MYPGCRVSEKLPLTGVTSVVCTNQSAGLFELRLVAQTCTVPVGRPPVTLKLAVSGAVARVVSTMVEYVERSGALSVTYPPALRLPDRYPDAESMNDQPGWANWFQCACTHRLLPYV